MSQQVDEIRKLGPLFGDVFLYVFQHINPVQLLKLAKNMNEKHGRGEPCILKYRNFEEGLIYYQSLRELGYNTSLDTEYYDDLELYVLKINPDPKEVSIEEFKLGFE